MAQEDDPTYAMERGTAVHAILFGNKKVIGYPGKQRRGKEWEAFEFANPDCAILTAAEFDKAQRMADAVRACTLAEPFMKGIVEETILFDWMGIPCRATPDVHGPDHLTELKTASSAEPMKFTWQARRFAYHAQMRMQQIGTRKRKPCFIVCVESEEPYPVTVFEVDKQALEIGEKLLVLWMERLKNCESSGHYPPYCQSVTPLIIDQDEADLDFGEAA